MKVFSATGLSDILNCTPEEIHGIIEEINSDLHSQEFKRPILSSEEEHFENGHFLHSSQYFFAKKYFQSSGNCEKLAVLLALKIRDLDLKDITLIGFRSYIGLLLSKTKTLLSQSDYAIDYAIIEQKKEDEFTWQFVPDFSKLKKNFLIVLPITCTCSTYIRIRKYLQSQIKILMKEFVEGDGQNNLYWKVNDNFINIFLIQEESIRNLPRPVIVNRLKLARLAKKENRKLTNDETKLANLYSGYNWDRIEQKSIFFRMSNHGTKYYIGHPLITLYSKLYLPEECPLCFPATGKIAEEKNIFPTHNNFETPNLLLGFPNFGAVSKGEGAGDVQHSSSPFNSQFLFTKLFASDKSLGNSHLYGHIKVNNNSYLNYIRGNTFYQQNRDNILTFFNKELEGILFHERGNDIQDIVFITSETKHNSTFLDEITTEKVLSSRKSNGDFRFKVHILRFDASNEFIDNFMTNYNNLFQNNRSILTIYFEEVITAGLTFKLVSNYLKHYKYKINETRQNRHGFDYIFTLIDRTPFFTKEELIKKLYSSQNENAEFSFITYFRLNVPIIAAAHLGNPLQANVHHLKKMILESHLDILKEKIGTELPNRKAIELPEENILINKTISLKYFPFENRMEEVTADLLEVYGKLLTNSNLELLKLYVAHQINILLSANTRYEYFLKNASLKENRPALVQHIIDEIWARILQTGEVFFTTVVDRKKRNMEFEKEIVEDTVIKILSRPPFTYYKDIYDSIFQYCLTKLDILRNEILENNTKTSILSLRKMKFFIRRLIDLDSSYLISYDFILLMKSLFENNDTSQNIVVFNLKNQILKSINTERKVAYSNIPNIGLIRLNNLFYKYSQANTLNLFLIYCYKESIFKNHYRSIRLEELINSKFLLPKEINSPDDTVEATLQLISNPYFHLTGMIKAENIFLLNELKNLHKKNYIKYLKQKKELRDSMGTLTQLELEKQQIKLKNDWPFDNSAKIAKYYFEFQRNDPIILNANKFIGKSRFAVDNPEYFALIKQSIATMLQTASLLMPEAVSMKHDEASEIDYDNQDFISEIRKVIQSVVGILQPGAEPLQYEMEDAIIDLAPGSKKSKFKYALCFEYIGSTPGKDTEANNLFIISSEDTDTGSKLDTRGLIYNLLYGLYSHNEFDIDQMKNSKAKGLQSLIVSVKIDERYYSFAEKFYHTMPNAEVTASDFNELYRKDCKNYPFGTGLSILNGAPMSVFLRLSELDQVAFSKDNLSLMGRAVLVITFNAEPTKSNFLSFMSNEKVRLLLLIKEELLSSLQKKFESDAFAELLKFRHEKEHKDSMGHMVKNYWLAMQHYLDLGNLNKHEIEMIKFIKLKIQTHMGARKKVVDYDSNQYPIYDSTNFRTAIENLMEVPFLCHLYYKSDEYDLSLSIEIPVKCHYMVFEQVFAEIIINMRRASANLEDDDRPSLRVYTDSDSIFFENKFNPKRDPEPTIQKKNGGKEMCIRILKKLGLIWEEKILANHIFQIKIKMIN